MAINQESKKIQYFIYLKLTLFLWATHKEKQNPLAFFKNLLKSILNMWLGAFVVTCTTTSVIDAWFHVIENVI